MSSKSARPAAIVTPRADGPSCGRLGPTARCWCGPMRMSPGADRVADNPAAALDRAVEQPSASRPSDTPTSREQGQPNQLFYPAVLYGAHRTGRARDRQARRPETSARHADLDVIVYVGTTDPTTTPNSDHRSRLLSAIVVEPKQILDTRRIVPPDVWQRTVATYRERWLLSMPVVEATQCIGWPYPHAHDIVPNAYRSFSDPTTRGSEAYRTVFAQKSVLVTRSRATAPYDEL